LPRIWIALIVNLIVGKNVEAMAVGPAKVTTRVANAPERNAAYQRVVEPLARGSCR
jgi:hypothetical protein